MTDFTGNRFMSTLPVDGFANGLGRLVVLEIAGVFTFLKVNLIQRLLRVIFWIALFMNRAKRISKRRFIAHLQLMFFSTKAFSTVVEYQE
jgi:hypothetical protein